MEQSLGRVLIPCNLRSRSIRFNFLYSFRLAGRILLHHPRQTKDADFSRRAIGQRWGTSREKKQKRIEDGYRYCVRICFVFFAPQRYRFVKFLCMERVVSFLWHDRLPVHCFVHGLRKLCYKPLYMFCFQWKLSSRFKETFWLFWSRTGVVFENSYYTTDFKKK